MSQHHRLGVGKRALSVPLDFELGAGMARRAGSFSVLLVLFVLITGSGSGIGALLILSLLYSDGSAFAMGAGGSIVFGLIVPFVVAWARAQRLVVGDDALLITDLFGASLVRYDRLQDVAIIPARRGRSKLVLVGWTESRTLSMRASSSARNEKVIQRIRDGMERASAASRAARSDAALSLNRGTRSMVEWREWLRTGATASQGFRHFALPTEALHAVLEDPGATVEQRVAAAIALRDSPSADPANVQNRLRIAADACAEPQARIAFLAAAADDIDDVELERALRRWQER